MKSGIVSVFRRVRGCPATIESALKAAVHWVRVNALSAESSPNLTWSAMGLRADSARNSIASHVNFGDDSALSAFTRT